LLLLCRFCLRSVLDASTPSSTAEAVDVCGRFSCSFVDSVWMGGVVTTSHIRRSRPGGS
jgi:hypothetical protein